MAGLKININIDALTAQIKDFAMEAGEDLKKGVANLAAITHAKTAELAASELKTTAKTLKDNLGFEEISEGVWVVSIDQDALFIEEGIEPNTDMKPGLLKGATKTSKDGNKYRPIPFEHSKAPSQMTPASQHIVNILNQNLKKENIPFKKIEKNQDGSPRVGKLHSLNIDSPIPGKGNTPALKGVSIYQTLTKTGNVRRDILTFRTVSSGPRSAGKFLHPGMKAKHFLERAEEWALKTWEEQIMPEILNKYK